MSGVLKTAVNPGSSEGFLNLTHGMDVDPYLAKAEIRVQLAWARQLTQAQYLSIQDFAKIQLALDEAQDLIERGQYIWKISDEDIHMSLERFLTERLGELGRRIHLGRSRNDLVATTLKLHFLTECDRVARAIPKLVKALCDRAEASKKIIIAGQTHRQAGQPIRLSQLWLSYAQSFLEDYDRFKKAQEYIREECPLGSGALSGTHLKIHLLEIAEELGFRSPPGNSYRLVGDRDFLLEFGFAAATFSMHISRLCEDVIYWTSTPVGLLQLPVNYSSGSSMMPNKRNPDFFEVMRAQSKKMISQFQELIFVNTAISSSYSSDFHEQKKSAIELSHRVLKVIDPLAEAVSGIQVHETRALELAKQGAILATDYANQLVESGMSFREAYAKAAELVTKGGDLEKSSGISLESSVEKRDSQGGTSLRQVELSLLKIRNWLTRIEMPV